MESVPSSYSKLILDNGIHSQLTEMSTWASTARWVFWEVTWTLDKGHNLALLFAIGFSIFYALQLTDRHISRSVATGIWDLYFPIEGLLRTWEETEGDKKAGGDKTAAADKKPRKDGNSRRWKPTQHHHELLGRLITVVLCSSALVFELIDGNSLVWWLGTCCVQHPERTIAWILCKIGLRVIVALLALNVFVQVLGIVQVLGLCVLLRRP